MGSGLREASCNSVIWGHENFQNFQAEAARLSDSLVPHTVPESPTPFAHYGTSSQQGN